MPTSGANDDALRREIFADQSMDVYAILDGASIDDLPQRLDEQTAPYSCLYSGQLDPGLASIAPYLVRLHTESDLAGWILRNAWGHHFGIFASVTADVPINTLRRHLRTVLRVRGANGKVVLFRYYDPRVLCNYLPSCNREELNLMFGPVSSYLVEDTRENRLLRFTAAEGVLRERAIAMPAA